MTFSVSRISSISRIISQFSHFFLCDDVAVEEETYRTMKIVPLVGETRSFEVMGNIKFATYTASRNSDLRSYLLHTDEHGNTYVVVDAFTGTINVYVTCADDYCIIWEIATNDSTVPP